MAIVEPASYLRDPMDPFWFSRDHDKVFWFSDREYAEKVLKRLRIKKTRNEFRVIDSDEFFVINTLES